MKIFLAALENGLSGNAVRASADKAIAAGAENTADARSIEDTVRNSVEFIKRGFDLAGEALGQAVDTASDKAFEAAAHVSPAMDAQTHAIGQSSFSWGGYFQALGILCVLLAGLWFAVWAIRRYGKFNFLPRPGALPRDSLVMEAQMPLGPRKGLMVVRFMGRRLLLGVTEQQISLLTEEKAQNERNENDFQDVMEDARNAHSDAGPGADSH